LIPSAGHDQSLAMSEETPGTGWSALLRPAWLPAVAVLVGGVLLHSMNVLMLATVLPSVVDDLGGAPLMSWTSSAFLASSIVAATCTGYLASMLGARTVFCTGALVFGAGALVCALAQSMGQVVAGRFVQGFGGGLLIAMAYVLVRSTFPESHWARAFALLSGAWSLSILVGPLVGGLFARYGDWRGAFFAVTAIAVVLALVAWRALPRVVTAGEGARVPALRVALVCAAIAALSLMAVAPGAAVKGALLAAALALLATALAVDRRAPRPLLPTDAFSPATPTGMGLWLCLLVAIAYSPLQIFVPIFLQGLHGLDPLGAGYMVAGASFGWTGMSLVVAGTPAGRSDRLLVGGPLLMLLGLVGVALLMPLSPAALFSRHRPGRRRHRRLLGLRRPARDERRAPRRGGPRRLVGRHGAADGLRARRGAFRPRRQRRRPVGGAGPRRHRRRRLLGAGELHPGRPGRRRRRPAPGDAGSCRSAGLQAGS
jgi:MFS family permease